MDSSGSMPPICSAIEVVNTSSQGSGAHRQPPKNKSTLLMRVPWHVQLLHGLAHGPKRAAVSVCLHSARHLTESAETQNRTVDTAIFSRVLYQLSYLGRKSIG
jgi:hypothetical protein